MKKVLTIVGIALLSISCGEGDVFDTACNCDYVVYDVKGGAEVESYRSSWTATCDSELLDETVFTYNGVQEVSRTYVECK